MQSPKCGNLNEHLHKGGAIELMGQMLQGARQESAQEVLTHVQAKRRPVKSRRDPPDGDAEMLDPFIHRKILHRGVPALATVLAISTPETSRTRSSQVAMTLTVELPGEPTFEMEDRWMVSGTEPIGVGTELRVVVDPGNHRSVAIDWERSHSDYRQRSDVRRKVLAGGVPVPVPAVQDALAVVHGDDRLQPAATSLASLAPSPEENDLTSKLERLAALRSAGSLTDSEFTEAKRRVLAGR